MGGEANPAPGWTGNGEEWAFCAVEELNKSERGVNKMKESLKVWKTGHYREISNPTPGGIYRTSILGEEDQAKDLGGIAVVLPAGESVPYHYHEKRESLLLVLSGEAVEVCEAKEYPVQAGDVIFIPAGAKHGVINRSDKDFRFLEFFTYPPMLRDFIKVE